MIETQRAARRHPADARRASSGSLRRAVVRARVRLRRLARLRCGPEMVRLRKGARAYGPPTWFRSRVRTRLPVALDTDAHDVLSLLDRGAHRAGAHRLSRTRAAGVDVSRGSRTSANRCARRCTRRCCRRRASTWLLAYAEIPEGQGDAEALRLALEMLPVAIAEARGSGRAHRASRRRLRPRNILQRCASGCATSRGPTVGAQPANRSAAPSKETPMSTRRRRRVPRLCRSRAAGCRRELSPAVRPLHRRRVRRPREGPILREHQPRQRQALHRGRPGHRRRHRPGRRRRLEGLRELGQDESG